MASRPTDIRAHPPAMVCVVDPDPLVRRKVAGLLCPLGATVEGYATAGELLARLQSAVPACIIVENRLPDMPGLALLQELRARGLRIPTIMLSGDDDVSGAVSAMRAGAIDFIEKPFIDRALVTQVAPIIDAGGRPPG